MKFRGSPRFWRCVGWSLFAVGCVGMVLPLLPTTIFWILAVLAFSESDPAMAQRIRDWPRVGRAVSDFLDHGTIRPGGKVAALVGLALSGVVLQLTLSPSFLRLAAQGLLALVALYIVSRPSRPR